MNDDKHWGDDKLQGDELAVTLSQNAISADIRRLGRLTQTAWPTCLMSLKVNSEFKK